MFLRPVAVALLALSLSSACFAQEAKVPPAAHRAVYTLALESARGPDIAGVRGTMAYELTDACDGWATRQRLSLTVSNRQGQDIEMVSDYATWESKDGLSMRFRMKQTTETAVSSQAEGTATLERLGGPGTVRYTVPEEQELALPAGTLFPTAHTEAILDAAASGKKFLAVPIFDGTGDKGAQDSSIAIIGWNKPGAAPYTALEGLPNGRVRIAFFDRGAPTTGTRDKPAGSPDYEVGMKYWANAVADDLNMDFTEFVLRGKLTEFELQPPHC